MRLRKANSVPRRGASMVEAAVVLTVFLTTAVCALDMSIAVFRHHVISHAARMGARAAIAHGSLASSGWNGGPWGTSQFGPVSGTSTANQAAAITPYLGGIDPSSVTITMQWPDSKNTAESRVSVTVTTTWTPIMGSILGTSSRTLTAKSVMLIAH